MGAASAQNTGPVAGHEWKLPASADPYNSPPGLSSSVVVMVQVQRVPPVALMSVSVPCRAYG